MDKDRILREPLKSYKDGKYLVFENTATNKVCKFDLSTHECIGFSGRKVKNVKSQLSGYHLDDVIDSFEDSNYMNFLRFIDENINRVKNGMGSWKVERYTNVGTFLEFVDDYSRFEQFFACGLSKGLNRDLKFNFNEIPKGLIKIIRNYDLNIDNNIIESYIDHPNLFNQILNLYENKEIDMSKHKLLELLTFSNEPIKKSRVYQSNNSINFVSLITEYKYKPKSLFKYIDNLIRYESLNSYSYIICELRDYAKMQTLMGCKFDKYPRYFLTTMKIVIRNYNSYKVKYDEELFKKSISLEYEFGDEKDEFNIVVPKSTDDVKNEGAKLNHCVASYINDIIDRKTVILFMRNSKILEKPLITLEIRNYKIVQNRGSFNRYPSEEEMGFIDRYKKYLNKLAKLNEEKAIA